jgi:hypothetical protein
VQRLRRAIALAVADRTPLQGIERANLQGALPAGQAQLFPYF